MYVFRVVLVLLAPFFMVSCISQKKYKEEQTRTYNLQLENEAIQEAFEKESKKNVYIQDENQDLRRKILQMETDTARIRGILKEASKENEELNEQYEDLSKTSQKQLATSAEEIEKLSKELDDKRRQLDKKIDEAIEKEKALYDKSKEIENLYMQLAIGRSQVAELEALLKQKEEAINSLKRSIEQALIGFTDEELTVEMKDGKLYVSLSEKLLFKSGSTSVDKKGKDALTKLAGALKNQDKIEIVVEGHTDNVPMKTNAIKDNWDLSVLRATSITRILTSNGVAPEQVAASGKGEYKPVGSNDDADGRKLNRRTEIILSPNLDEVIKVLGGNIEEE